MRLLTSVFIVLLLPACAYTPSHEIPVHREYIYAGVEPGDQIEIVTMDGRELTFVVAEIEVGTIVSEDGTRVEFEEIATIAKRSWQPPAHPCGAGRPVGCSVPGVIETMGEVVTDRFHNSCVQHDYCYRHGYATYGEDRETCDERFYEDMKGQCGQDRVLGILAVWDLAEHAHCLALAESMYRAVVRYGEAAFLIEESTVCPYELK